MTGPAVPELASFDRIIPALMEKYEIPGAAIAVTKDGRLIFARGYGKADPQTGEPVHPDSLFRIASVSKPLTSAAILKLVESGRLRLEDKAFRILDNFKPPAGAPVDGRLYQITIRQLLQHSGGWDRDKEFDPMFISARICRAMGTQAPADHDTIIRYMMGQPLQFDPGTKYCYSNFGYCVLGRVIEKIMGQSYEAFVKREVLGPAGVSCTREGRTLFKDRAPGEVTYASAGEAQSVFPGAGRAPWPYGGWCIEAMDSHGGWIASAVDLMRFVRALDAGQIIRKATLREALARPAPPIGGAGGSWYGLGWQVVQVQGGVNYFHTGSLDGTSTILVKAHENGLAWVALYNSRPRNSDQFDGEMDNSMWKAIGEVRRWPEHDLFGRFEGCRR